MFHLLHNVRTGVYAEASQKGESSCQRASFQDPGCSISERLRQCLFRTRIAEELEQLVITERESITMLETVAEINKATAASVTRADMDMAVFCHKVDEQRVVSGMWSEVHLLHRLRVILEQEALPIEDLEELEVARRVRLVMADLSTPANNPVTPNNQSAIGQLPTPGVTGSSATQRRYIREKREKGG